VKVEDRGERGLKGGEGGGDQKGVSHGGR